MGILTKWLWAILIASVWVSAFNDQFIQCLVRIWTIIVVFGVFSLSPLMEEKLELELEAMAKVADAQAQVCSCCSVSFKNNELTNTRDAQASLGTPKDASAVTTAHHALWSAMRSNDDINWAVHFFLYAVFLWCLPSTVHCSVILIFGSLFKNNI